MSQANLTVVIPDLPSLPSSLPPTPLSPVKQCLQTVSFLSDIIPRKNKKPKPTAVDKAIEIANGCAVPMLKAIKAYTIRCMIPIECNKYHQDLDCIRSFYFNQIDICIASTSAPIFKALKKNINWRDMHDEIVNTCVGFLRDGIIEYIKTHQPGCPADTMSVIMRGFEALTHQLCIRSYLNQQQKTIDISPPVDPFWCNKACKKILSELPPAGH